jgi:hypothetical protein
VYVNGETGQFWVMDYRLYDPDGDGQSKLDHVAAMLNGVVYSKQLPFTTVLMDSWYATQKLMAQIDQLQKVYYCPLKTNRRVDDSGGTQPYQRIDELVWSAEDLQQGKLIKVRGFPTDKKVKLFRVTVSTNARTLSLPTTYLKLQQMSYKMCVMFVGKLRSFTANSSS